MNVLRTCERIAQAVRLEDQVFPKRCSHMSGKEIIPRDEYQSKLRAAAYALKGIDCMLIARTDAYRV